MNEINKKISVITVVKNGMPFVKSAIKSFTLQTYQNKEMIIVYSPSNDGTEEYLKNIKEENIIVKKDVTSKNRYGSINVGIDLSKGEIFGLLHSDDVFYNEKILDLISKNISNEIDLIYGDILYSETHNLKKIKRVWKSSKFNITQLKYGWMPPHTSIFMKKIKLDKQKYNENFNISSDYHFILKMFNNKELKIKYINNFITVMRLGGDSTKIKNFYTKFIEDLKVCKIYNKNYLICSILKILRKIFQIKIYSKNIDSFYLDSLNL